MKTLRVHTDIARQRFRSQLSHRALETVYKRSLPLFVYVYHVATCMERGGSFSACLPIACRMRDVCVNMSVISMKMSLYI